MQQVYHFITILFLIVASCTPHVWAANTHGKPDSLSEMGAWVDEMHRPIIVSGCAPTVPVSSLTVGAFACTGYVRGASGGMVYVSQDARAIGPLSGGDGTYWLAITRDTSSTVSGWTRQVGTQYLWQKASTQPANTGGVLVFMKVTVASSIISAVEKVAHNNPARYPHALNVQAFGATGDGATDDTTAIQAALDALDPTMGGTVFFPPGTYCLSHDLRVSRSHSVLQGAGPGASVLKICTYWNTQLFSGSVSAMVNLIHSDVGTGGTPKTHISEVVISGLGFDATGNGADANSPKCLSGLYADNVWVMGNRFINAARECIQPVGSNPFGTNWIVTQNIFFNCGVDSTGDGTAIQLAITSFTVADNILDQVQAGIGGGVAGGRVIIKGNLIRNLDGINARGIGISGDSGGANDVLVDQNQILFTANSSLADNPRRGILVVELAENVQVSNNNIHVQSIAGGNSAFGIDLVGPFQGCALNGNQILIDTTGGDPAAGRVVYGIHGVPDTGNALACTLTNNVIRINTPGTFVGFGGIVLVISSAAHAATLDLLGNVAYGFSTANNQYAYRVIDTSSLGTLVFRFLNNIMTSGIIQLGNHGVITDNSLANIPIFVTDAVTSPRYGRFLAGGWTLGPITFSQLGTPGNGAMITCSDCQVTSGANNTCTSGGTGALAMRINSAWRCFATQN